MGIEKPEPPQEVSRIATAALDRFSRFNLGGAAPALRAAQGAPTVAEPHKVYTLGLDGIVEDASLAKAKMVGWMHLVMSGGQAVASTEVKQDERGGAPQFSNLNAGVYGASSLAEMRKAEEDPRYQKGSYEPRLLRIPGLDVRALWLKDKEGDNDVVIPIAPTHTTALTAGRPYSVRELTAALLEPAKKRLEFDSSPRTVAAEGTVATEG
jgi:hypothetical protein